METQSSTAIGWANIELRFSTGKALLICLTITLLSCHSGSSPSPAKMTEPSASVTPVPTQIQLIPTSTVTPLSTRAIPLPSPTLTPSPSAVAVPPTPTSETSTGNLRSPRRTQYALSASLDYEMHHLEVSHTITYVNHSDEPLFDLLFVVESNRQPGVFRLKDLRWADGQPIEDYTLEGARLRIALPEPLTTAASIRLHLFFELNLPPRSGPFGYTARQTNLGDWYPFLPPYRPDQGWVVHEPAVTGEHLVYDDADYQVDIHLAGRVATLTVAASGLIETNQSHFRYQLDAARSFAWSASSEYMLLTETVDSVTVGAYVFPEHYAAGSAALRTTVDALALYSEMFGPYSHPGLIVVEADFADGMEYDGLYFLGREYYAAYTGDSQGYLTAIAAHETAHQWWYGLVGNDQAMEPWLDESLATYSELLFYEKLFPDLIDWWWGFRVTRFNPLGWVNSTVYDHGGFRPYVNAVYLRGALFLQALRNLIGDEVFFAFLRDYATRSTHGEVTAQDFFSILAAHRPADTSGLISSYFAPRE